MLRPQPRREARVPDVALLDLGPPDMDGYELARRLQALFPAEIRLIAVSGDGRRGDRARTASAGFEAHFAKPVHPSGPPRYEVHVVPATTGRHLWPIAGASPLTGEPCGLPDCCATTLQADLQLEAPEPPPEVP